MLTVISTLGSLLSFRLRGRASLELELIALRHQVTVLRRLRPGRPKLCRADRLLWVWLCRIWPQAFYVMVLVKPATVIQWHRKGFRLYWRWRSRAGQPERPRVAMETRDRIRQMSTANPLWGRAPDPWPTPQARFRGEPGHRRQIHAVATQGPFPELAQLPAQPHARYRGRRHVRCRDRGVSVALHRNRTRPRPTTDHSLQCHAEPNPGVARSSNDRGLSLGHLASLSTAGLRRVIRADLPCSRPSDGDRGSHHSAPIAVTKRLCRAPHRLDPPRMSRSRHRL